MFKNLWEIENKADQLRQLIISQSTNPQSLSEYAQILELSRQALSPLHLSVPAPQACVTTSPLLLKPSTSPEPKQSTSPEPKPLDGSKSPELTAIDGKQLPGTKALPAIKIPIAQESPKPNTGILTKSSSAVPPPKPKRPTTTAYHGSPISAQPQTSPSLAISPSSPAMSFDDTYIKRPTVEARSPPPLETKVEQKFVVSEQKTTIIEPDSSVISESLQNSSLLRGYLSIELSGELRRLWFSNKKQPWKLRYFVNDKVPSEMKYCFDLTQEIEKIGVIDFSNVKEVAIPKTNRPQAGERCLELHICLQTSIIPLFAASEQVQKHIFVFLHFQDIVFWTLGLKKLLRDTYRFRQEFVSKKPNAAKSSDTRELQDVSNPSKCSSEDLILLQLDLDFMNHKMDAILESLSKIEANLRKACSVGERLQAEYQSLLQQKLAITAERDLVEDHIGKVK